MKSQSKKEDPLIQLIDQLLMSIGIIGWGILKGIFYGLMRIRHNLWAVKLMVASVFIGGVLHYFKVFLPMRSVYKSLIFPFNELYLDLYMYSPIFYALLFSLSLLVYIGLIENSERQLYQAGISKVGLKNKLGEEPRLLHIEKKNDNHSVITFQNPGGIPKDNLKDLTRTFPSVVRKHIGEIKVDERNPSIFYVNVFDRPLERLVKFSDIKEELLKQEPGSFCVGKGRDGLVFDNLYKMPHILIAGATGGGKSVCLHQLISSLLLVSDHLQMYIIDLKMGVEAQPYEDLKNVKVFSNIEDALKITKRIKLEMDKRYELLRKFGDDKLYEEKHKKDRIVLVFDEASVAFMKRSGKGYETLNNTINELRDTTEELSKLARASGIHLVIGLQNPKKSALPTEIRANLRGIMSFQQETYAASISTIGTGAANRLPGIEGRGIWKVGVRKKEVQGPFLNRNKGELKDLLAEIKNLEDEKNLFNPMIDIESDKREKYWNKNL